MASSHTTTLATPSPPLRTDTPYAGQTSLSSSCALAGKSSSANHITQTWVSAALFSPSAPCSHAVYLCSCEVCQGKEEKKRVEGDQTEKVMFSDQKRAIVVLVGINVHQAFVAQKGKESSEVSL